MVAISRDWNMKDRNKKILKYTVSLAVAAILLYFSFKGVKWTDFISGLQECRWGFVALSMVVSVAAFWLRGLRWRQILLPIDPATTRLTAFNAVNIGYIANFIFPRIGEFVRCGVISARSAAVHRGESLENAADGGSHVAGCQGEKEGSAPERNVATYDKVLGTVVLERGWDLVVMLLVAVALLVFRWEKFGSFFVEKMWRPVEDSLNFSVWWVVLALVLALAVCCLAVWKFRDGSRVSSKIISLFKGVLEGFTSAFRMKGKLMFILYTVLIWVMYWLMAVCTMLAVPDLGGLNAVDALFLMVAGSFGWLVPVPGGFGSFHFIVSLALSTIYGIPFGLGIIFATLSHESQAVTMALCGGISWFYETFRK